MKITFTAFLLFILFTHVPAQPKERTISGQLKSDDGSPLPGVNVVIKGTEIGTTTDADGFYSLNVQIGSTVVFSFIGMATREVVVTEDNLKPLKKEKKSVRQAKWPAFFFQDTTRNQEGVALLTAETPTYKDFGNADPSSIVGIRTRNKTLSGADYFIKTNTDSYRSGFGLQFNTAISLEVPTRIPALQTSYAQGRAEAGTLNWKGPDQNEIFSWGPLLRTLEFDGTAYDFDKHGRLVTSGTGNGKPAIAYDPTSFLRNGLSLDTELLLALPGPKNSTVIIDGARKSRSGSIPNSDYTRHNLMFQLKNIRFSDRLQANIQVTYHASQGNLLNRGSNLSSIIGTVLRTPVTFDNSNLHSEREAINSVTAFRLSDGTPRSHAPGIMDNPYGLANEMPDLEKMNRLLSIVSLRYQWQKYFKLNINSNFDKQWNKTQYGLAPGLSGYTDGRLTQRNDILTWFNTIITPSYQSYGDAGEFNASISYQYNYHHRQLDRKDGFGLVMDSPDNIASADSLIAQQRSLFRITHELLSNLQFSRNWLNVRLANRTYFSNTLESKKYTNLFPTLSIKINLDEILYINNFHQFTIYASASKSIQEAPLIYTNAQHLSTRLPVDQYHAFFEDRELFFNTDLLPETVTKIETGIELAGYSGFSLDVSYFNNRTNDFIAPVWQNYQYTLINAARTKNYGTNVTGAYNHFGWPNSWGITLRWSKYNTLATEVYTAEDYIAIAGFESVASVLAENKPVGAIYGTSFLKDPNGRWIIGDDGFPVVDQSLKMIGNPIPDWTLTLEPFYKLRKFRFSFLLDFKRGGTVWNGTQASLNYLGRSVETEELRNTSHTFEGVNANGDTNTIPVTFYDPAKPLEENRWVRYGFGGVGEEHIEDASWIRLSELALSYTTRIHSSKIKEIKFSLVGRNLFLITPYSGIDPSSSLFGYSGGTGLDLFNMPSTRNYSAQITIKL